MYSTLLTLAVKTRAIISSSLFSSKYFYFYIVKVVAKAPSIFQQHHMILICLVLFTPLIPLASHISALLFKQVCRLVLAYCIFSRPATQLVALSPLIAMPVLCPACFYFICILCCFILFYFSWLFCLLDCFILLFMKVATFFIFICLQKK